ncbi:hypothetical protein ACQ86N_21865 [Puia sp. P3]|uniref:hypothetical protein n=1 Tax=Puia sp. P3 TaxID=3423952 RepID=UPI003D67167D
MKEKEIPMQIVHPNAAGIDIGSKTHWVAVDQNLGNVREFGVYTRGSPAPDRLFKIPPDHFGCDGKHW